jgi:hypothetical protein
MSLNRYVRQLKPKSVKSTPPMLIEDKSEPPPFRPPFSITPTEPLSNLISNIPCPEIKCEIDSTHMVKKVYLESGPHSVKIVCDDCGDRFIKWAKDDRSNPYNFENDDDNHNLDNILGIK